MERPKFNLIGEAHFDTPRRYYEYQEVGYPYKDIKEFPLTGGGIEKFLPLLPVRRIGVFLPGRLGDTPVTHLKSLGAIRGLSNLWVKHEECNPTGCFKDRESAVVISVALERGVDKVVIASSGNAALSTAAYARRAGITCVCYVPEKTTQEKKDLIKLFGAKLITIPGFYEDVYKYVVDTNPDGWNVTAGQNVFRTEGNKTIAYEMWEQLGVPDTIVVPSGNGSCLAGIWKGFVELKKLGKIDKLPQMVSVQIKDAAPLKAALAQSKDFAILDVIEDSIAEGIVALESYTSPKAVRALQESKGYVVEVTDQEIIEGLRAVVSRETFIPEPTSATVYAALPKLRNKKGDLVVVINTGSGMKVLSEIARLLRGHST